MADPLAPYPAPVARDEAFVAATTAVGGVVFVYGQSVEGRPLVAARVPQRPPIGDARTKCKRVLVAANIHGIEFVGNRLAERIVEALGSDRPVVKRLRARAEVVVAPCLNPDGYARTWAAGGRGSVGELRCNAHGVDLNRNFPRPGGVPPSRLPGAGSDSPQAATYRGPGPLSEPETAALDAMCAAEGFWASVNLHSFMGTMIPARTRDPREFTTYVDLCRRARSAQPAWRYRRISNRVFDVFTGEQEDHQHHAHGTWAVCHEVFPLRASFAQHLRAPATFWRFNPHDPEPWVNNDLPAVLTWLDSALELPDRPAGHAR